MRIFLMAALGVLAAAGATAQSNGKSNVCFGPRPGEMCACLADNATGAHWSCSDTNLSRAMTICRIHLHSTGICFLEHMPDPNRQCSHEAEHGWESCLTIEKEWWQSEDSRVERERIEQEKRDKEFVERIAKEPK